MSFFFKATGIADAVPKAAVRIAERISVIQLSGEKINLKSKPHKKTAAVQQKETRISGKKVLIGSLRYLAENGTIKNIVLKKIKAPLMPATP